MNDDKTYFAGLAMQAIIAKLPLMDTEGEHGKKTTREENATLYDDVAESAWKYATAMCALGALNDFREG